MALQISAASLSVRGSGKDEQPALSERFEYELLDTGVFAGDKYFDVEVEYAKVTPGDIVIRISATNRGADTATLHILPTIWFRNTWRAYSDAARPELPR